MPTRESVEAQALHFEGRAPDPDEFAFRLASDPVFAAEMRFANEHGIPHSVLRGRVRGVGDPEWLPEDLRKAIAYQTHEAQRCGGCGLHPTQWPIDSRRPPYRVELERCQGCMAKHLAEDDIPKEAPRAGLRTKFVKLDDEPTLPGLTDRGVAGR